MHVNTMRLIQFSFFRWAIQSVHPLFAITRDADDFAFARKIFANGMIFRVGDNYVSVEVNAEMLRPVERCESRIAAVCRPIRRVSPPITTPASISEPPT